MTDDPNNTLARTFQTIEGLQPRTQNLTNLIASLNPWERHHIRVQLGPRDGLAGFEDLTVDLACLLVRHLHLEDVLTCAAVCTRSHSTWTDPSAVAAITLHFFPALQPPFTFAVFRTACRKYLRRRAGNFTTRLYQPLPDVGSSTLEGEDRGVVCRLDPGLHPDGGYPRGWNETLIPELVGYGKGNIVWLVRPHFFVVDNLYTRARKVVAIPDGFPAPEYAAAGKLLVVFFHQSKNKLLVYNLETDTSSQFKSPSPVWSVALRDRRIFLSLDGPQVCVLDHDGTHLLTTCHFNPAKGLEGEFPQFRLTPRPPVIYPHPHLQDCFFVVLFGWLENGKPNNSPYPKHSVNQYLLAREYEGASPIATHEWQPPGEASSGKPDLLPKEFIPAWQVVALDDQGTYHAGSWVAYWGALYEYDLPQPPRGFFTYIFQVSFNVMTKRFAVQRYLDPRGINPKHVGYPWQQQVLVPWARQPGERKIRRYDADNADIALSRVVGPGPAGARPDTQGWALESEDLVQHTAENCRFYHDSDFTVRLSREVGRFYVWSFVEGEEGTATGRGQSSGQDHRRRDALNAGDILRTQASRRWVK